MSREVVADKNWREEGNPLDLNNLPEDNNNYPRDGGKQTSLDTSSSAGGGRCRKKKSGGGKEDGKVYECRFCSLKFCKSQALGGHMNRHRQERETETLNKARQLVFTNDLAPVHLGYSSNGQPITSSHGVYHHHQQQQQQQARQDHHHHIENTGLMPPQLLRPMYPPAPRMFSTTSPPQPQATYTYPSPPPPHHIFTFQAAPTQPTTANEYFLGQALNYGGGATTTAPNHEMCNNYTCIGTPVVGLGPENTAVRDRAEVEGLNNWGRR